MKSKLPKYDTSDMERAIYEVAHRALDRIVLRARLMDGRTYREIAEMDNVKRTERQVQNIMDKYKADIFDYLRRRR